MKTLRLLLAALIGLILAPSLLCAQTSSAVVVASCGTPPITYSPGQFYPLTMDEDGNFCGSGAGGTFNAVQSGNWNVGGLTGIANSASRTRVANTTTYTANTTWCLNTSTTACVPLQVAIAGANAATGTFGRVWLLKSGSTLTNANFTIWFYSAAPTTTSQYDDTAYVGPFAADLPNYLGSFTCNAMQATNDSSAESFSECTPNTPSGWMQYKTLSGEQYVDALISVTAAYAPASAEVLTVYANSYQDK